MNKKDARRAAYIATYHQGRMREILEAAHREQMRDRRRRRWQVSVALVVLLAVYAAAIATTWMLGSSGGLAALIILPLYGLLLFAFYASGSSATLGYTSSSVEHTPTNERGEH